MNIQSTNLFGQESERASSGVVRHGSGRPSPNISGIYVDDLSGGVWLDQELIASSTNLEDVAKTVFWGGGKPVVVAEEGDMYLRVNNDGSVSLYGPGTPAGWPELGQGAFYSGAGAIPPTEADPSSDTITLIGVTGSGDPQILDEVCWHVTDVSVAEITPHPLTRKPVFGGEVDITSFIATSEGVIEAGAISILFVNEGSLNAIVDGIVIDPGDYEVFGAVDKGLYEEVSYNATGGKLKIRTTRYKI